VLNLRIPLLFIAALLISGFSFAQIDLSNFEFFDSEEIIECKLTSDFKFLRKEKFNTAYQPAEFTFYFASGDSVTTPVRIKARGIFRRKHCSFAPIKIKFSKEEFAESSIAEYNSLKLVTHCRDQSAYTDQLIEEYIIYQMYNLITPYSLRARMVKINYVDTGSKKSPGWNYGFFIEDIDQVAARNNAVEIKTKNVHPERLNRYNATMVPVFQYMIGNTDWSVPGMHNIKLLKDLEPDKYQPISVAYDFDYAGFVNAPYAVPPEMLGIEDVKTRIYRGFCRFDYEFQEVFDKFIENKEEILALIEDNPWLSERSKKEDTNFILEFFQKIESDVFIERTLMAECQSTDQ